MKIFPDVLNVIQNVSQLDPTAVFTGSNQWSNRFGEIKWINLVDAQVAILKSMQNFRVGPGTSSKGFDGQGMSAPISQTRKQKRSYNCFADARICSGDEDGPARHVTALLTPERID